MIRDNLSDLRPETYDVCIVGAGPAGISLAMALARRGLSPLVLESGDRRHSSKTQDLSTAEIVDPERHHPMSIAVSRRLGGTSNLWGGRCVPYDPIDFEPRAGMPGWPLGYDQISPYFAEACKVAHCGSGHFEDPAPDVDPRDDDFSIHTLERWSSRPRFQIAHRTELNKSHRIDVRLNTTVVDVNFAENGLISSVVAARHGGRRHTIPVRSVVLAVGGLESTRLLLALQRRHPARFGGPQGPLGRYYMGHLVGEIADIVFGTDSVDRAIDYYLSDDRHYVRRRIVPSARNLTSHNLLNIAFWPVVPPIADSRHCSGDLSLLYLALSLPVVGPALIPAAIRRRHLSAEADRLAHLGNVVRHPFDASTSALGFAWSRYVSAIRKPGYFRRNTTRRYGLFYQAEQSPRAASQVRLGNVADELGLPQLVIDYRVDPGDVDSVVKSHVQLERWLSRTGLGRLEYRQPTAENERAVTHNTGHGAHQIGTARLGLTRTDGVVDRNLATFDCANLFVASSAVLPRSGHANPTLMIIAFALRLAEHLASLKSVAQPEICV